MTKEVNRLDLSMIGLTKNNIFVFPGLVVVLSTYSAYACNDSCVRDGAFNLERDMYLLCVISNDENNDVTEELTSWLEHDAKNMNVSLEYINSDDRNISWMDYGMPSAPPEIPVVALIGRFPFIQRTFIVDHWQPYPEAIDLEILQTSPVRQEIKEKVIKHWAVILYSPGIESVNESAANEIDKVFRRWELENPPGIEVVKLDRTDPKERLLQLFIGLKPMGPDWAGIVFGRGFLMTPPLKGDEITEERLNHLLKSVKEPCTCLQRASAPGLAIPMTWDKQLDEQVVFLGTTLETEESEIISENGASNQELLGEDYTVLRSVFISLCFIFIIVGFAIAVMVMRNRRR